ncbi:MAG: hypothetical protein JWQ21_2931 [Herminiimonas sp.]|nr:hypothetical protein [Herminiimonas sp.]
MEAIDLGTEKKNSRTSRCQMRLAYLRSSVLGIVGWPLFCLFVGAIMWCAVLSKLADEKVTLQKAAFKGAASLAKSYAEQLSREVGHLDQIARSVAFYWAESKGTLQLERQKNQGIYPSDANLYLNVAILNRDGLVKTSLHQHAKTNDLSDRVYFQRHKSGQATGLQITRVDRSRVTGKPAVIFSHPLTAANSAFAGVVYVAVHPDFLASFFDQPMQGTNDTLAVLDKDGNLIASQMGENVRSHRTISKTPPTFATPKGVAVVPGEQYIDNLARIVAWQTLDNYPLVSIVALAEKGVYAPYETMRRDYVNMALSTSVLLALIAAMGMYFSVHLAWKRHQTKTIKDTYRLATDNAREAFYMLRAVFNPQGGIVDFIVEDCNERGCDFLERPRNELIGSKLSALFPAPQATKVLNIYRSAMEQGFHEDEFQMPIRHSLKTVWMQRRIIRSGDGLAMTLRDISEAKAHEHALSTLANSDALTGLSNRHWLSHYLPSCLENAKRQTTRVAVLYIDLDDFKNINNIEGHAAGDKVLHAAGQRMKALLRPGDHVARLGGDEFTIILAQITNEDDVAGVAARLIKELSQPYVTDGHGPHVVKASIGISLYPEHGEDMPTLLTHADVAMYAAKANGKGTYQFYTPDLSEKIVHKLTTEQALRQAIETDQFVLHYQPRVDTYSGELRSLEALVRWMYPERGLISPLAFIPLAEETGLIVELGALVLEKACAQLAVWQAQGLPVKPVSVNVSPRQFSSTGLKATIAACLSRNGVNPSLLELEITESCMMGDSAKIADDLAEIKAMGIRISVDDFGTGYSSLSQLQRLDLDVVKVDQSFTRELTNDEQGHALVTTIISMAHSLDMEVVAEGVETPEQLQILQALSCNQVQGYLISRPVVADEAAEFLRKRFLFGTTQPVLQVVK